MLKRFNYDNCNCAPLQGKNSRFGAHIFVSSEATPSKRLSLNCELYETPELDIAKHLQQTRRLILINISYLLVAAVTATSKLQ